MKTATNNITPHYRRGLTTALLSILFWSICQSSVIAQEPTLLLRQPALSDQHIAFVYGGDLWISNLDGTNPRRLTSHPATESSPKFSPDGKWIAFSANYESNMDVYVISVAGGPARRLTWHPGDDTVNGWSVDGKNVLFASARERLNGRSNQLFHIALEGAYPEKLMEAHAFEGAWSADGKRLAFRPWDAAQVGDSGWRLHRGGSTPPVWIIDLDTQAVEKIPHPRANESNPMWQGDTVYFMSDRDDQAVNLFSYNTVSKDIRQLTNQTQWDIKSASIFNNRIIFEAGGRLQVYDIARNRLTDLSISINPDSPQTRPAWKDASSNIQRTELSPTGKRALITARGDIFTVPLKNGSTRNITATGGVREKDAIWSPQGDKLAYISDQGSIHTLIVTDQTGRGEKQSYKLGDTDYYTLLAWGKKGKKVIYEDNHLNLFFIELSTGKKILIRTDLHREGTAIALSSDGKWLAYTNNLANYFSKIMLYEFSTGKSHELTDGLSLAWSPVFSRDGKYLYLTASTNAGPHRMGFDLSSQEKPLRNAIYAIVLAADGKSPLLPKSGDELDSEEEGADESSEDDGDTVEVVIDLSGIARRFVALPIAERNYSNLSTAEDGSLYFMEQPQPGISNEVPDSEGQAINSLKRFDFEEKKVVLVTDEISGYTMSDDGKKLLLHGPDQDLLTADIAEEIDPKPLDTSDVKVFINPRDEWRQIFDETWRLDKQFFYAENMHGIDWQAVRNRYEQFLPHVSRREDLNELLVDMIAELQVGHSRIGGGDTHQEDEVNIGLLGADLRVENNNYRIKKIYTGERWNPFLKSPLAPPGIGVSEGDYILAINGVALNADTNIFSLLAQTVGNQVTLSVSKTTSQRKSREIVVEPIASERALRRWNWIEENRQYVEEKTDGRVGYVYVPDTADDGFTYFNRMFFTQSDKEAMIIDERSNGGGQVANYITDVLSRVYLSSWKDRDGLISHTPGGAIYGPKVMLIDQDAGSGGDFLPYAFRHQKLGKLIGTRTWGGLIGTADNPELIDGGELQIPGARFFNTEGEWRIENEGVAPDIEVDLEPDAVNRGVDTQLDRAIAEVMSQLENYQPVKQKQAPRLPTKLGL